MKNLSNFSRRGFDFAAAGLNLASAKKLLALSQHEVAGNPRSITLTKRCNSFSTTMGVS